MLNPMHHDQNCEKANMQALEHALDEERKKKEALSKDEQALNERQKSEAAELAMKLEKFMPPASL